MRGPWPAKFFRRERGGGNRQRLRFRSSPKPKNAGNFPRHFHGKPAVTIQCRAGGVSVPRDLFWGQIFLMVLNSAQEAWKIPEVGQPASHPWVAGWLTYFGDFPGFSLFPVLRPRRFPYHTVDSPRPTSPCQPRPSTSPPPERLLRKGLVRTLPLAPALTSPLRPRPHFPLTPQLLQIPRPVESHGPRLADFCHW